MHILSSLDENPMHDLPRYIRGLRADIRKHMKPCQAIHEAHQYASMLSTDLNSLKQGNLSLKKDSVGKGSQKKKL